MSNTLSKRLLEASKFVDQNSRLVDVGSDHAYLPISLVENNTINFAIAGEVAQGPLNNSLENIKHHQLEDKIEARLGDGLEVVNINDNIDTAVIAGMGGILITDILQRFVDSKEFSIKKLILQPNIGESLVRTWLMNNKYRITAENILEEDGHTYEIIVGEKTTITPEYSRAELLLGPVSSIEKNTAFNNKWHRKLKKYRNTLAGMEKAQIPNLEKIAQLKADIAILEDVLND